jgi:F-type H+-transporting ATPase subunit alpha
MDIRPAEISEILKQQIAGFDAEANVAEVGTVLTVGDGIARVYGLQNVMAGEMVDFPSAGLKGHGAQPRDRQRRHRHLRRRQAMREGDTVSRTGSIVDAPVGKGLLGRVVDGLGNPIDGKGPLVDVERKRVEVKAPGIIPRKSVHEPMQTGIKAIDA